MSKLSTKGVAAGMLAAALTAPVLTCGDDEAPASFEELRKRCIGLEDFNPEGAIYDFHEGAVSIELSQVQQKDVNASTRAETRSMVAIEATQGVGAAPLAKVGVLITPQDWCEGPFDLVIFHDLPNGEPHRIVRELPEVDDKEGSVTESYLINERIQLIAVVDRHQGEAGLSAICFRGKAE